jgi:UDP-glucose 4-epimerase
MVVPRFVRQALRGEPITIFGDGTQSRCFSYVGDVVRGVLMLAESDDAVGEVFNIGTDQEVTIIGLANRIRELLGSDSDIQRMPYASVYDQPFEDVRRRVPDLGKIRRAVGYEPNVDLDTLLRRTIGHILVEDGLTAEARYAEFVGSSQRATTVAASWAPLG